MPVVDDGTARLFETGNLLPVSFSPGTTMAVGLAATAVATVCGAPTALPAVTVASTSEDGGGIEEDGEVNDDPEKAVGLVRKLLEDDPSAAAVLKERRLLVAASMPA